MEQQATEVKEEGKFQGFLKHVDKLVASSTLILIFWTAGFYFTTKDFEAQTVNQYKELKIKVNGIDEKVNEMMIEPVRSAEEMKALKEDVIYIKEHQQKTDDRLDKIYDLLLDMSNKKK